MQLMDLTVVSSGIVQLLEKVGSIPDRDLKNKLLLENPDLSDDSLNMALDDLTKRAMIEISTLNVGSRSHRMINLTAKAVKRSISASL
jgi:hypothetical protein